MKVNNLLQETFECVKIGNVYRNLNTDELKIYKTVKKEGKVYKQDLPEYEQNVATTMVSKGLLRRKKEKETGKIYYSTIGRNGRIKTKDLDEVAPPDREIESWIKKNKASYQAMYGDGYEKYLYSKAWHKYNGKKPIKESEDKSNPFEIDDVLGKICINNTDDIVGTIVSVGLNRIDNKVINRITIKELDTDIKHDLTIDDFMDKWIVDDNTSVK